MNTMKAGLGIRARTPEYLAAKHEAGEARKAARAAENRLEWMTGENERHADEVAVAERWGYDRLVTNQQAAVFTGGAATVVYRTRCRADGHDCDHDPRESPYSDTELHAAAAAIAKTKRQLTKAEKALADLEGSSFDVAEAVRDSDGPPFAWWPDEVFPDPSKRRWQGKPLTADEVDALGPLELQRLLAAGGVIEVQV